MPWKHSEKKSEFQSGLHSHEHTNSYSTTLKLNVPFLAVKEHAWRTFTSGTLCVCVCEDTGMHCSVCV